MFISLISAFRDSERYMSRFFQQAEELDAMLGAKGHHLQLLVGEGDSEDFTRQRLISYEDLDTKFVDVTHGGKKFDSVVNSLRFLQCAYVGNVMLMSMDDRTDIAIYVESDLIWSSYTMMSLLTDLVKTGGVIAPKIILKRDKWPENSWYDTYAFWAKGKQFEHMYPYHPVYEEGKLVEVDSVGSCFVTSGWNLSHSYFKAKNAIVGLCENLQDADNKIWLDTRLEVWHE